MTLFWETLPAAASREIAFTEQLVHVERARPSVLMGEDAYLVWLELFEDFFADELVVGTHLLPAKPCAQSSRSDLVFQELSLRRRDISRTLLSLAAPTSCTAEMAH